MARASSNAPSPHDYDCAITLATIAAQRDLNEADTRHQIIDEVLHGVLSWPRNLTGVEHFIDPGFADYYLKRSDGAVLIIIEAKRDGAYFDLPDGKLTDCEPSHVRVKTLLTDPSIAKAISQVHTYCVNNGCPFAAITNGHTWIFFRTFQSNQDWRELHAFVIPSLRYFSDRFTDATNKLGYRAIAEDGSLTRLLGTLATQNRAVYYPKEDVTAFSIAVYQNRYAQSLRRLVERYFQRMDETDPDFMEMCYVTDASEDVAFKIARARVTDAITPYLDQFPIRQIDGTADGGAFGKRLQKSVRDRAGTDVVVLFGGKGVGKSTFLRRLLFYKPPQVLKKHSLPSIIDLIDSPDLKEELYKKIWDRLLADLDKTGLLKADRPSLLELFADRFEVAKKQDLYGLQEGSDAYNIQLNTLVQKWQSDHKYCARKLSDYWWRHHRRIIVIVDNTDQFSPETQDFCFEVAHEISKELNCLAIISMREERFYASSIKGTLDAFHNSGFHISAPSPTEVFQKRLRYVIKKLTTKTGQAELLGEYAPPETITRTIKLFKTFENEFVQSQSHLADFLSACAHGNIRIALEMFREFVLSGYTNVTEMTSVVGYWKVSIHQVLKPIMIPRRFFYEESESQVPNIYQIRSRRNGSHFTAIRILTRLMVGDPTNRPYVAVPTLLADFSERFNMREDAELCLDMLLRYRLVEANNRIDEYRPEVDSVRITSYGSYLLSEMSKFFTYIELVAVDCAIFDQSVANAIVMLSNQEFMLWEAGLDDKERRVRRVQKRLEKAETFIKYLQSEEQRERDLYGIHDEPAILPPIAAEFAREKIGVLRSARRQRY